MSFLFPTEEERRSRFIKEFISRHYYPGSDNKEMGRIIADANNAWLAIQGYTQHQ